MTPGSHEVAEDGVANPVFHHVNLTTNRLDEMIEWYGLAAGLRPNFRDPTIAFLTNDHANHRLALLSHPALRDDPEKIAHTGIHHTAFEFASLDDLLTRYETLKAAGIVPHSCLDHGLTTSFYYADPDGNNVEMQVDNFGDWAASAEAGADPQEIHRRGFAGAFAPAVTPSLGLPEV